MAGEDEYQPLDENAPLKTISFENYLASSLNWRGPQSVGHPGVDIGLEARPYNSRIDNIVAARLADLERRGGASGAATAAYATAQAIADGVLILDDETPDDPNQNTTYTPSGAGSNFLADYIAQSISPIQGLIGSLGSQEQSQLAALEEALGLSRDSLDTRRERGSGEIRAAGAEADAAIEGLIADQIARQASFQAGTDVATGSINDSRTERAAQLIAAVQAAGGDVSQIAGSMSQGDANMAREQAANQTALSSQFASNQAMMQNNAASSDMLEQSAMSQLSNNYTAAATQLDAAELASRTEIEQDFASRRAELEYKLAEATMQARREAEAEQARQRRAAAAAAANASDPVAGALTLQGMYPDMSYEEAYALSQNIAASGFPMGTVLSNLAGNDVKDLEREVASMDARNYDEQATGAAFAIDGVELPEGASEHMVLGYRAEVGRQTALAELESSAYNAAAAGIGGMFDPNYNDGSNGSNSGDWLLGSSRHRTKDEHEAWGESFAPLGGR